MSSNDPFSMGRAAGMGDDYRGDAVPSPEQNLSSAFAKTAGYANETGERAKAAEQANQIEPVFNAKTGTWDLGNVPNDALQAILNNAKQFGQIQQIYQKQIDYNQQQQEGLKAHPFANALSQIAASVGASSKDPLVRGLGDAAQRLNPTLPQLQQQQQGMLKGAEGALSGQADAYRGAAGLALAARGQDREDTREKRLQQDELRKAAEDKAKNFRDSRDKWLGSAQKGEAPSKEILTKLFSEHTDPKTAAETAEAISKTNEQAAARIKRELDVKERHERALESAITDKGAEKRASDKALEETARALAAGDLASIQDVSSMRNDSRMKLFARIKEIDPKFDMAGMRRKIDTQKLFTTGKEGEAIKSFDTFLQHAGEVTETLKGVEQSNVPAFNKPMNWWKSHMAGTPEYQRLITSIEPVTKEFEKFLLNQGALYKDDRKNVDKILNGESSPLQIMAALNEMGKTAGARYGSMNQRYKRVMGKDIQDAFSEGALQGASKIGVNIPQPKPESAANADPDRARADSARVGETVTIRGKRYKKLGQDNYDEVK